MRVAAILIMLAPAALAAPAVAQPDTLSVVANAHAKAIAAYGPDAHGNYQLRIDIADLDPATDAGWRTMQSRVDKGTDLLCTVSAEGPQVAGFYNSGDRQCRRDTAAAARAQMDNARDSARAGRRVASLALSTAL